MLKTAFDVCIIHNYHHSAPFSILLMPLISFLSYTLERV